LTLDITEIIVSSSLQSTEPKTKESDTIPAFASLSHTIVEDVKEANRAIYSLIPWRALTDCFFETHRRCGMYLGRIVKLCNMIIQSRNQTCLEMLCIAGFFDRLVDQYLENEAGSDLNAHVCHCISHMIRSNQSVPETDMLDWKTMLGGQPQRWDQVMEMVKDPDGLVYFLAAQSDVKPVIAAVPVRVGEPAENILAALNASDDDDDDDSANASVGLNSSAASILASITRSLPSVQDSGSLDDCEPIADSGSGSSVSVVD
jgi:hypothetical protein